jgi:hypothetical protein
MSVSSKIFLVVSKNLHIQSANEHLYELGFPDLHLQLIASNPLLLKHSHKNIQPRIPLTHGENGNLSGELLLT